MSAQTRDAWEQKKQAVAREWLQVLEVDTVEAYEQFAARYAGSLAFRVEAEEARHRRAWLLRSALLRDMMNAALRRRYLEARTPELRLLDVSLMGKPRFFQDRVVPFLWRAWVLGFVLFMVAAAYVTPVLVLAGCRWLFSDSDRVPSWLGHLLGGLFSVGVVVSVLRQLQGEARKGEETIWGDWEHGRWLLGQFGPLPREDLSKRSDAIRVKYLK